jgi:lipid II:glycine glycyltransferase (peptidoglycan interpeptide bridge formation enzyme)
VIVNRDEYVNKLKAQLDAWNAEAEKWEAKAKEAQASARVEYERQLAAFRRQRDEALEQMRKIQAASGDAWQQLTRDADQAWEKMREMYEKTSAQFFKK